MPAGRGAGGAAQGFVHINIVLDRAAARAVFKSCFLGARAVLTLLIALK